MFDVSPARGSITFLVLYAFGLVFATVFFGVIGLVVLLVAECVRVTKPDQPTPWHKVSDIPAYVLLGAVLGAACKQLAGGLEMGVTCSEAIHIDAQSPSP